MARRDVRFFPIKQETGLSEVVKRAVANRMLDIELLAIFRSLLLLLLGFFLLLGLWRLFGLGQRLGRLFGFAGSLGRLCLAGRL